MQGFEMNFLPPWRAYVTSWCLTHPSVQRG